MAAANFTLLIPRTNFIPGSVAAGILPPPGSTGYQPALTEAQLAGTRPPFNVDTTLWSTLMLMAPSPYRTVNRQVIITGDAAWIWTHLSTDLATNGWQMAAGQSWTFELNQEKQIIYVAALAATVNLRAAVLR